MKQLFILVIAALTSAVGFANAPSTSTGKNATLNALSSAFTTHKSVQPGQHDINMVYGGADVTDQVSVIATA